MVFTGCFLEQGGKCMNKRMKKKRAILLPEEKKYEIFQSLERKLTQAENGGYDVETVAVMNPIKDTLYKYYGKKTRKKEFHDLIMMRLLCSVDYALLEQYKKGLLSDSNMIKKAKLEQEKIDRYHDDLLEQGNAIIKLFKKVEEEKIVKKC